MPTTRSDSSRSRNSNNAGKASAIPKGARTVVGNSSSAKQLTAEQLAAYQLVRDHLEAQKKANKQAEDTGKPFSVRTRNRELLDAEEHGSSVSTERASKKQRTTVSTDLSDDEQEIAAGLPSIMASARQAEAGSTPEQEEEEEERPRNAGDDENLHDDLDGVNVDDVDMDEDLGLCERELSNELTIEESPPQDSTFTRQKHRTKGALPKTPRPKSRSISASNTAKVVESHFTPRTLKLALASKSHVRTRTIYDEPFPRNNKISRINFAWKTIKEAAMASDDIEVRQAFKRATADTTTKGNLMKFTLYGRTGLVSSVISKAREKVRAYYGLVGDPDSVKKDVEWLLKDSHFVYGGINLKERTVDQMKPFGSQLIVDIIEAQWFPSTSRSKLDLGTTNKIYESRNLPLNVVLLVVTAIEHALKEWCTNGRKASQITFSEDTARLSYERHLRHWKFFECQTKAWPAWWRKTVLEQILANHSNFDINDDDNDFAALDFGALDRLAGYEEGEMSDNGAETQGMQEARKVQGVREASEAPEARAAREERETRKAQEAREAREERDLQEARERASNARKAREVREASRRNGSVSTGDSGNGEASMPEPDE